MASVWKDMSTIDSSLASSLQSVNSSLASFFAAIITVALVWLYFQIGKFPNKCIRQRCISLLPGTRLYHWSCLSGVGDWISEYRTRFTKNGIQYKIPHFLGLWRNTRGNSHRQSIFCWKNVSQQCFRQDWCNYQGRILLLYAILEQLLIFGLHRCGIISGWWTVGFCWTSILWGLCLSWLRRCFLYPPWRTKLVLRVYASRVQWDLQLQVNANLISAFSLTNK